MIGCDGNDEGILISIKENVYRIIIFFSDTMRVDGAEILCKSSWH